MIKQIFLILTSIILLCSLANATSLNPGKTMVMFEPNKLVNFEFTVTNTHGPDKNYYILVRTNSEELTPKDLETLLDIPRDSIPIQFGRSHRYKGSLRLPETLAPGEHEIYLTLMDDAAGAGMFGARVHVSYKVEVYSPYPGKYVRARMAEISPVKLGEVAVLNVNVMNLGLEDISSVTSAVEMYDGDKYIETYYSSSMPMKSKQTYMMPVYIDTKNLSAGIYSFKGKMFYDSEETGMSTPFKLIVGDIFIDILRLSNQTFFGGRINKWTIDVLSKWNKPIREVYATGQIKRNGRKKIDFKTESVTVGSLAGGTINAFADLTNLIAGSYDMHLALHYGSETTTKVFQIRILPGEIMERPEEFSSAGGSSVPLVPILLIVVLILVNLLAYTYLRGKKVEE